MTFVDFKIYKDGKDTGRTAGIACNKTISVDLIADLLVRYRARDGYELVLDKIWEEKDNGKHRKLETRRF